MENDVNKKPLFVVLLILLFGPFGFFYYSWKKALMAIVVSFFPLMMLIRMQQIPVAKFVLLFFYFLMSIFAYFDLKGFDCIEPLLEKIVIYFTLLLGFLNILVFFSVLWLLLLGQWPLVALLFVAVIFSPILHVSIFMLRAPLRTIADYFKQKRNVIIWRIFMFLYFFIYHFLIMIYVFCIFSIILKSMHSVANNLVDMFAFLLFGYEMVSGPFANKQIMLNREGLIDGLILSILSYISIVLFYILGYIEVAIPIIIFFALAMEIFLLYLAEK